MTLLDLIVVLALLIINVFHPLPWGIAIFLVATLIVERALKGERL